MEPARPVFCPRDSLEHLHHAVPRVRQYLLLSLHPSKWVWLLNISSQSVPVPFISLRRQVQDSSMGSYSTVNHSALVSRKSGKLAVLISLRHDPPSLDVSFAHRQWSTASECERTLTLRRFGCHQRHSCLAIPLD